MSGIAGEYRFGGRPADAERVARMLSRIAYRGPDAEGVWHDAVAALGHRTLHVTPESLREPQPLVDPDAGLTLTADARIDNREALAERLGLAPEEATDGAVILAAYERWGVHAPEHLLGDFAFALWDGRERRLLCARDPFGIRPFCYYHRPGRLFAFASEPLALLEVEGLTAQLDELRLAHLLGGGGHEEERSLFEGVRRLPPASRAVVTEGGVRVERYWRLQPQEPAHTRSADDWVEGFRERLAEAVRCRLRSAYPVGAHVSGGLDSTSVACLARDARQGAEAGPLHTFSIVFSEHTASDERAFIEPALRQGGVVPHFIDADRLSPFANMADVYRRMSDGLAAGNQHFIWNMLAAARDEGVRVMLDGMYGDRVVEFGFTLLTELLRAGQWDRYAHEVKALTARHQMAEPSQAFLEGMAVPDWHVEGYALDHLGRLADRSEWRAFAQGAAAVHRHFGVGRTALYRRFGRRLVMPWSLVQRRRARAAQPPPLPPLIDPGFAERMRLREREAALSARADLQPQSLTVRELQRVALARSKRESFEVTDHFGARFGIEQRHPFLDLRLIEFCLQMPSDLSLRDGWLRYAIRAAMEDVVPDEVRWRVGKGDMGGYFEDAMRARDMAIVEDHLANPGPLEPYLNADRLRYLRANAHTLTGGDLVDVNVVVALGTWARQWIA